MGIGVLRQRQGAFVAASDETGQTGYIKITLDEEGYWACYPAVLPGDDWLEAYFGDHITCAG